ncbi:MULTISPECIES: RNA polymerase Rpb4 family protein [Methanocorpusculum]|jgi:DNA-directed RNA polymerase subunit F|uniref:RNA polymerase Rpb4 family protein n=1 Tax=Methanocorpusculum TaxID=2192 RepID=UPI0005B27BF4|nr:MULTISPECIES: RNA polymerase Rpb4 family protein [Methanocorpusculum]MDD4424177.1 RNA polymerase Rpb4 family protein [Methanocorpusculum parvum]MDD2248185.1 RNA polymerase Rpb4 family protein [Methanocorpusculum sp.]MDD2802931.1 RNA polymerase Rpb4 family protein [Methanocorpusculum sp.]MDD3046638.1 RNA polymerase Rpb4 family protein [Methanocorpusculum sp.]MDD3912456.1 RNA polymerase Rpb4 family protein [Methanocorpusculum sp.]
MKVKKIISEDMMTLPELRVELIAIREKRSVGELDDEPSRSISYELRKSIDHADSLSKCSVETAKSLLVDLASMEKTKPEIACRIVNIMPQSRDEIRAIYAKERFTLLPEDLDQILDTLHKYE